MTLVIQRQKLLIKKEIYFCYKITIESLRDYLPSTIKFWLIVLAINEIFRFHWLALFLYFLYTYSASERKVGTIFNHYNGNDRGLWY